MPQARRRKECLRFRCMEGIQDAMAEQGVEDGWRMVREEWQFGTGRYQKH
jgi:hypothetical protein